MQSFERVRELAAHLGFKYKRNHLAFPPNKISAPFWNFLKISASHASLVEVSSEGLSNFTNNLEKFLADISVETSLSLASTSELSFINLEKDDIDALGHVVGHNIENLKIVETVLCEMFLITSISSLEAYIQDIVYEIYTKYPKTLRSGQTLTYEEALKYSSMSKLVAHLARKEAAKSTEGTAIEYLGRLVKKFKVKLEDIDFLVQRFERCVAIRNVIVHNNGVVDASYLRRQPTELLKEGDKIELNLRNVAGISEIVRLTANFVEIILTKKFPKVATISWSDEAEAWLDYICSMEESIAPDRTELSGT